MELKPYPEYKESDFDWLGQIPSNWDIKPGLFSFSEKKDKNVGLQETTVLSLSYGRIVVKPPEKLHGLVPESFETYQIVNPGDIIIRSTDLQNDWNSLRVGLVKNRGIITSAYICLKIKGIMLSDYCHLLLHSYDLMKFFYGMGSGLRQNLSWSDFKRLIVPIPPKEEQQQIVTFLDSKTKQFSRFIRSKQKLIKLLEEQKQVIISQAVTKGLGPNVKLKPSGIDYLGDIPDHWKIRRLRTLATVQASSVNKKSVQGEEPVRLCNYVDVYKNDLITNKIIFMSATASLNEIHRFQLKADDIIITKDSESWEDIAVPAYVPEAIPGVVCAYHLTLLRPFADNIEGEFLFIAFCSDSISNQFRISANGVTRFGLSQGAIKGAFFPIPPKSEQELIIEYINIKTSELDKAVSRTRQEIELVREFQTRLISDVVTGKVDVRNISVESVTDIDEIDEDILEEAQAFDELEEIVDAD